MAERALSSKKQNPKLIKSGVQTTMKRSQSIRNTLKSMTTKGVKNIFKEGVASLKSGASFRAKGGLGKNKTVYEKVKMMAQKNIEGFLLKWKDIDILSPKITDSTTRDIMLYAFGVNYIITTMHKSRWLINVFSENVAFFNGLICIYKYILAQSKIAFALVPTEENAKEVAAIRSKCSQVEKAIISLYKTVFTHIPPTRVISENHLSLCLISYSMHSQSSECRLEAMLIIKTLLKQTRLHHLLLLSFKKCSKELDIMIPAKFILSLYDVSKPNDKLNSVALGIIGRIYCSKAASPHLSHFVKNIENSGIDLHEFSEKKAKRQKTEDPNYWKEKFFALQNEMDDLENAQTKLQQLSGEIESFKENIDKLSKDNEMLKTRMSDVRQVLKSFNNELNQMQAVMLKYEQEGKQFPGFSEISAILSNLNSFSASIDNIASQDLNPAAETKVLYDDKIVIPEEILPEIPTDPSETEDAEKVDPPQPPAFDLDFIIPPPPPIMAPPPPCGPEDPGVSKRKLVDKLFSKFSDYFSREIIEYVIERQEKDNIKMRVPFLNFTYLEKSPNKTNMFTEYNPEIVTKDRFHMYLKSFLKNKEAEKTVKKQAVVRLNVLSDNYVNLIHFVLKKIGRPPSEIIDIIDNYDVGALRLDEIELLMTTSPKPEDFSTLVEANKLGHLKDPCEIFSFNIWSKSYARSLINFMEFHINYNERYELIERNINKAYKGIVKIANPNILTKLFQVALLIGNFTLMIKMKDPIHSYSLEGLEHVFDTKSSDGTNLLKYILTHHYNIEEDLPKVKELIAELEPACSVSIQALRGEIDAFTKKIETTESIISSTENLKSYKDFVDQCLELISPCQEKFSELIGLNAKIRNIYCIESSMDNERFIALYKNLALKVQRAMEEIAKQPKKPKEPEKTPEPSPVEKTEPENPPHVEQLSSSSQSCTQEFVESQTPQDQTNVQEDSTVDSPAIDNPVEMINDEPETPTVP